jgi:hypothetical protein
MNWQEYFGGGYFWENNLAKIFQGEIHVVYETEERFKPPMRKP